MVRLVFWSIIENLSTLLNKKDSFSLPQINNTLQVLTDSKWFLGLDWHRGYWQVAVHMI